MKYELPKLPYAENALEPVISKRTVEFHWGKHEQTYINNLNKLIEGAKFENASLESIIKEADGALFNNASQAWNHIFYFFSFSPDGAREPKGEIEKAIKAGYHKEDEKQNNGQNLFQQKEPVVGETMHEL